MIDLDLFNAALDELARHNQLQAERDERNAIEANQMLEDLAAALSGELFN